MRLKVIVCSMNNPPRDVPVKSISVCLSILEYIRNAQGCGVTEISREMDIPKSTVHDYTVTLEQLGFVHNDSGKYRLSLKFLDYGGDARKETDIYLAAWREVQKLALETGEHANLMIEEFGRGRYLYIAEGEESATLDTYTGMQVPLHVSAMGKSILANLPQSRIEEIIDQSGLEKRTENTIIDEDALVEELEDISSKGYATDNEERTMGVRCVSAPVIGRSGEVYGSVGVSGPTNRLTGDTFNEELPTLVQKTANIIELNIANR